MIPISLDVISLYTNIPVNEAIETTLEYVLKHKPDLHGLLNRDLWELLYLLLDNNVFSYNNIFFQQIRGLAMGNRLSGTLAIICMDKFERAHITTFLRPAIYARYVDDISTIVHNTEEAQSLLTHVNSQHQTIKFEMELPDEENYLPILDLKIAITSDGTIDRKLYSKPANKGITLHYESHHPSSTKNAMIRNELQRAEQCSTTANRTAAVTTTIDKLSRNGYPKKWLTAKKQRRKKKDKTKPSFTLRIPFVSDQLNHQIKRTLKRHGIPARLVNPRGQTIKDLTKPRKAKTTKKCSSKLCPAPDICHRSNVVYLATCTLCNETYVGMTTRKLHDRAYEHLLSARKRTNKTAIGDHYRERHPEEKGKEVKPSVTFKIIKHQRDLLRLHIEESMAIKQLKPTLNRRLETLGTGFLI